MSLELWADEVELRRRLETLGLAGVTRVTLHENRSVMVSVTRGGVLRLHRGYVYAPDRILGAVVRFVDPRTAPGVSRCAQRDLLSFPVEEYVPVRRPVDRRETPRPEDRRVLAELARRHAALNQRHFAGRLRAVPVRLSGRMRSRLGELVLDGGGREAREIVLSRRHLRRDGWAEAERTLLHEMVHQWQAQEGLPVDHGPGFRRKALEVGVEPYARRPVARAG